MTIDLNTSEKGGKTTLAHDLNFASARYESKHPVTFKNPSQNLIALLRDSGPVPGDENGGVQRKKEEKKRKRPAVDMEKLADGLVKLDEEDLLQVVQMIHDNKSPDSYTKNDVEREFFLLSFCSFTLASMQERARLAEHCVAVVGSGVFVY